MTMPICIFCKAIHDDKTSCSITDLHDEIANLRAQLAETQKKLELAVDQYCKADKEIDSLSVKAQALDRLEEMAKADHSPALMLAPVGIYLDWIDGGIDYRTESSDSLVTIVSEAWERSKP